jgi:hypothetical protein
VVGYEAVHAELLPLESEVERSAEGKTVFIYFERVYQLVRVEVSLQYKGYCG